MRFNALCCELEFKESALNFLRFTLNSAWIIVVRYVIRRIHICMYICICISISMHTFVCVLMEVKI